MPSLPRILKCSLPGTGRLERHRRQTMHCLPRILRSSFRGSSMPDNWLVRVRRNSSAVAKSQSKAGVLTTFQNAGPSPAKRDTGGEVRRFLCLFSFPCGSLEDTSRRAPVTGRLSGSECGVLMSTNRGFYGSAGSSWSPWADSFSLPSSSGFPSSSSASSFFCSLRLAAISSRRVRTR